jgi:formamidopyrimidine-DNA glycosylase
MPELPEVETVCRALRPHLEGRLIRDVSATVDRLRRPLDLPALRRRVRNRRIRSVRRRAKYLLFELQRDACLIVHLGMTGAFRVCPAAAQAAPHDRLIFTLSRGESLRLEDMRRFSDVRIGHIRAGERDPAELPGLGPEPLSRDFNAAWLHAATRNRRRPVKNLVLDQAVAAGMGNIYASEALWRAGIRPDRESGSLRPEDTRRLVREIRATLREALEFGGTTIINFKTVDGSEGRFRRRLRVYGRTGLACRRRGCPGRIRRLVQSGRSSFFCPRCQE